MKVDECFLGVCFIPLDGNVEKFFGFSEFLAGLALMVLAWTIADVRYRFRVQTAPIPLRGLTFSVISTVGVLTLLTDLWRAEKWLVPKGNVLTPSSWQAILGGAFLLTFLTWAWFAFIRPPKYGKQNAERFAKTLYRFVLKGSPTELAVVADELAHSAQELVKYATDRGRLKNHQVGRDTQRRSPPKVEGYANDLLLLIADKRLCRSIVSSSPGTALAIFQAMADTKKHGIQVETFARNIVNEALTDNDSFLYHETEGFNSGLIGYHKPISQALFSNYAMAETIGTLLDPDIYGKRTWEAPQWEAYCRIVLMTLRSYAKERYVGHSYVLYRAKSNIEHAPSDLYTLNEHTNVWDTEPFQRLGVVVDFIKNAVEILDKNDVPQQALIRKRKNQNPAQDTFYDHLASMIFEVIFHASAISSPRMTCWTIQHNSVWGKLFNFNQLDGPAGRVVKFKARRLLYDEIVEMKRFPNFKGAKLLGFCLNVMGLKIRETNYDKDSRALQKAILAWTRKNFVWLHSYNSEVAEACLVDGFTFDEENQRLIRTSPAGGLRTEASHIYFELDRPVTESKPDADRKPPKIGASSQP